MLQNEVAIKLLKWFIDSGVSLSDTASSLAVIQSNVEKCFDDEYNYVQIIDAEHHHIHLGQEFQADYLFASVAANGYARMRIKNDDGKGFHMLFFADTEAKAYYRTYLGTTYTIDGTPYTPWNRSTYSSIVSVAKVYIGPTINVLGATRAVGMTGSGQGSGQIGGTGSGRVETLLCTGCDFLIEVQNKSTTAKDIVISARWYEVPEVPT
jgi:hypothetical protein